MKNKPEEKKLNPDEVVQKMVEEWDIVRCKVCGKKVSMLEANLEKGGQFFICKIH